MQEKFPNISKWFQMSYHLHNLGNLHNLRRSFVFSFPPSNKCISSVSLPVEMGVSAAPHTPNLVLQAGHTIFCSRGVPKHTHGQLEEVGSPLGKAWGKARPVNAGQAEHDIPKIETLVVVCTHSIPGWRGRCFSRNYKYTKLRLRKNTRMLSVCPTTCRINLEICFGSWTLHLDSNTSGPNDRRQWLNPYLRNSGTTVHGTFNRALEGMRYWIWMALETVNGHEATWSVMDRISAKDCQHGNRRLVQKRENRRKNGLEQFELQLSSRLIHFCTRIWQILQGTNKACLSQATLHSSFPNSLGECRMKGKFKGSTKRYFRHYCNIYSTLLEVEIYFFWRTTK